MWCQCQCQCCCGVQGPAVRYEPYQASAGMRTLASGARRLGSLLPQRADNARDARAGRCPCATGRTGLYRLAAALRAGSRTQQLVGMEPGHRGGAAATRGELRHVARGDAVNLAGHRGHHRTHASHRAATGSRAAARGRGGADQAGSHVPVDPQVWHKSSRVPRCWPALCARCRARVKRGDARGSQLEGVRRRVHPNA